MDAPDPVDPRHCTHDWRLLRRWFHPYRRQWWESHRCRHCRQSRSRPVRAVGTDADAV